jgi:uncharacterized lipoprotein YbaY
MKSFHWGLAVLALTSTAFAVDPQRPASSQYQPVIPASTSGNYYNPALNNIPGAVTPSSIFPGGSYSDFIPSTDRTRLVVPGTVSVPVPNPSGLDPRINPNLVPGSTQQPRWRLGVYSKDTDTGVRIIQVVQGGAAARAGLEPNDLIISVNGFQVGYVNGVLYDTSSEFERLADQNGWVNMLVLDSRNRQVVNLPVQLDSRLSRITGAITSRDNYQLPNSAVAIVELKEIVRAGAPMVTLATRRIVNTQGRYPIPFDIDFDPLQVDSRRTYVLSASIVNGAQTVYMLQQPVQVLSPGSSNQANLVLDRVTAYNGTGNPYASRDQQIERVVAWFREYLRRDPSAQELLVYRSQFDRGLTMQEVQADVLGHPSVWNQSDRDKVQYVVHLHEMLIGRQPTNDELAYWVQRYDAQQGIRRDLAREFLAATGNPGY